MTRKLDKEHLEEIQTLRDSFAKNANTLGNIAIELHMLTRQQDLVTAEQNKYITQFESLTKQESELESQFSTQEAPLGSIAPVYLLTYVSIASKQVSKDLPISSLS